jgi:hypothetical protein
MQVLSGGPDRGNPTPRRQGRGPRNDWATRRFERSAAQVPVRAGLVEAIGVRPFRTKVKRRKASGVGKSVSSDKARYLLEPLVYWRRDGREI